MRAKLCGRAAQMTFRAHGFPRLKVTLPARRLMPLPTHSADPNDVGLGGSARRLDHLVAGTAIGANARLLKVRAVPKMVKLVSRARAPVKFHGRGHFNMAVPTIPELLPSRVNVAAITFRVMRETHFTHLAIRLTIQLPIQTVAIVALGLRRRHLLWIEMSLMRKTLEAELV